MPSSAVNKWDIDSAFTKCMQSNSRMAYTNLLAIQEKGVGNVFTLSVKLVQLGKVALKSGIWVTPGQISSVGVLSTRKILERKVNTAYTTIQTREKTKKR